MNGCRVKLALSDDKGEVLSMTLLCADEEQARKIKRNFRRSAEQICQRIVGILCDEGK